jgi:hypothetical protein
LGIGVAVGLLAVIGVAIALVWFFVFRRRQTGSDESSAELPATVTVRTHSVETDWEQHEDIEHDYWNPMDVPEGGSSDFLENMAFEDGGNEAE